MNYINQVPHSIPPPPSSAVDAVTTLNDAAGWVQCPDASSIYIYIHIYIYIYIYIFIYIYVKRDDSDEVPAAPAVGSLKGYTLARSDF